VLIFLAVSPSPRIIWSKPAPRSERLNVGLSSVAPMAAVTSPDAGLNVPFKQLLHGSDLAPWTVFLASEYLSRRQVAYLEFATL
jgi:hypothetical protein